MRKRVIGVVLILFLIVLAGCFKKEEEKDTVKPILMLKGDAVISIYVGTAYIDAGATATDDTDGDITSKVTVTILKGVTNATTVDTTTTGAYTIKYNVSDAAGNKAIEVTRTVNVSNVSDTTKPVINIQGTTSVSIHVGDTYTDAGVTVTDNADTNIASKLVTTIVKGTTTVGAVDTTTTGAYIIKYNVTDAEGNAAIEVTRTVNVLKASDTIKPVIALKGTTSVSIYVGDTYTDAGVTVTDNADTTIASKLVTTIVKGTTTVGAVDTTTTGAYIIKYNVTDAEGNAAIEVTRTVVISAKSGVPANTIRVHYHRWDGIYTNWSMWAWGDTTWSGTWAHGLKPTGTDDFGIYFDLPLITSATAKSIGFFMVIETNGTKDSGDRTFAEIEQYKEIWVVQDSMTNFTAKVNPDDYKPIELVYDILVRDKEYVEIDKTKVKLLFKSIADAAVKVYLGETAETMTLYKELTYSNASNVYLEGLTADKTYYYRVTASKDAYSEDSGAVELKRAVGDIDTTQVAEWARKTVFYEIFVRAFYDSDGDGIGDLNGVTAKLDYLQEMGITGIWLMPIFEASNSHGYDVTDYQKVDPDYGTEADLQNLLTAAHNKGIKIILDIPVNHTSYDHPWFIEARAKADNQYRDYFVWETKIDGLAASATGWTSYNGVKYYSVFGATMPDLNLKNYMVREEMKKVAKHWLDIGIDGFRLDASMHVDGEASEVTHNWWQEFNTYCKSLNSDCYIVGENWTDKNGIAPFFADMDSSFNFPESSSFIFAVLTGFDVVSNLLANKTLYSSYNPNYIDATFTVNHDSGLRAASTSIGKAKCGLLGAIFLTSPGTPFIYYGEEIGQPGSKTGGDDHMREPLDWYTTPTGIGMTSWIKTGNTNVIAGDGTSVEEEALVSNSTLNIYKKFGNIRKDYADIFTGDFVKMTGLPTKCYGYEVSKTGIAYKLDIIHNYGTAAQVYTLTVDATDVTDGNKAYTSGNTITIPVNGSIVLKRN